MIKLPIADSPSIHEHSLDSIVILKRSEHGIPKARFVLDCREMEKVMWKGRAWRFLESQSSQHLRSEFVLSVQIGVILLHDKSGNYNG